MAGRSKDEQGPEVRDKRTSVRWTKSEYDSLEKAQQERGIKYLVDVPRVMTLQQIRLEEVIGDKAELLEKAREALGVKTTEEAIWTLARRQLETYSSLLEKDVAE
jgi:hypothetical protein